MIWVLSSAKRCVAAAAGGGGCGGDGGSIFGVIYFVRLFLPRRCWISSLGSPFRVPQLRYEAKNELVLGNTCC